jgi:putative colanic acid biosysnthesis UDP-glucose lipid carrier transferase
METKKIGIFQRHGALLIQTARLVDSIILFAVLYGLAKINNITWNNECFVIAFVNIIFFAIAASFYHLYRPWRVIKLYREVTEVFVCLLIALFLLTFFLHFFEFNTIKNDIVIYWFLLAFLAIAGYRYCVRIFQRSFRTIGYDRRNVGFIGMTATANELAKAFANYPWMGIDVVGFFDDRKIQPGRTVAPEFGEMGNINDLLDLVKLGGVDAIYITFPMSEEKRVRALIDLFSDTTVSIFYCPTFSDFNLLNCHWDNIGGQPIISIIDTPFIGTQAYMKRLEDLLLVFIILPMIALPMVIIALAVKFSSSGPVLYKQSRYGLDGKEFKIWKFRTMYTMDNDQSFVQAKKGDTRITPVGQFLRKSSLDELPQFINVLLGDMSIVGPRPHPVKLNEDHRRLVYGYMLRHKVKPGITGLAQVNGFRGETDSLDKMEKRVEYDLKYMKDWSPWLDMEIIYKTLFTVFHDVNAY